jgi:hypothetical protein
MWHLPKREIHPRAAPHRGFAKRGTERSTRITKHEKVYAAMHQGQPGQYVELTYCAIQITMQREKLSAVPLSGAQAGPTCMARHRGGGLSIGSIGSKAPQCTSSHGCAHTHQTKREALDVRSSPERRD